jgi:hypothetical protein
MFVFAGCLFLSVFSVANAEGTECVKGVAVPEGGDYSDWPKLFRLTTPNPADPTLSNMDETTGLVDPSVLLAAGVGYSFLDPTGFTYPNKTKEIPWSPPVNGTNDPALQEIRDKSDYQYADIVVVTAYNEGFYEEHIHAGGDEVRYIIEGSGYFGTQALIQCLLGLALALIAIAVYSFILAIHSSLSTSIVPTNISLVCFMCMHQIQIQIQYFQISVTSTTNGSVWKQPWVLSSPFLPASNTALRWTKTCTFRQ